MIGSFATQDVTKWPNIDWIASLSTLERCWCPKYNRTNKFVWKMCFIYVTLCFILPPCQSTAGINGLSWAVREIIKSSSTFSATNICSNIVWFIQLHETIQMKSNHTWINYNHDNIAISSHIVIYNFVWKLIFGTKFSSIYFAKGEKRLVFRLLFVNLQRAKDATLMFDAKYRYVFVV